MSLQYKFSQAKYFPGRRGICLSLSALWARTLLDGPKDSWASPSGDPKDRKQALLTPTAKNRLVTEHAVFIAKTQRFRHNREQAGLIARTYTEGDTRDVRMVGKFRVSAGEILANTGHLSVDDVLLAINTFTPVVEASNSGGWANIVNTVEAFGVRVTRRSLVEKWAMLPQSLALARAHIIYIRTGKTTGHAFGVYQTNGAWSTDFHLFDPNVAEFKLSGSGTLTAAFGILMETPEYGRPTSCDVLELRAV